MHGTRSTLYTFASATRDRMVQYRHTRRGTILPHHEAPTGLYVLDCEDSESVDGRETTRCWLNPWPGVPAIRYAGFGDGIRVGTAEHGVNPRQGDFLPCWTTQQFPMVHTARVTEGELDISWSSGHPAAQFLDRRKDSTVYR